ncbi:MAG TPA: hypothetical protein VGZ00_03190 [Candidatus Baltobacteraceae bacterium]|jgi:hypothetical protein|nr:hypothetical protein [Candidatus Baltobacteraceae bacterium]
MSKWDDLETGIYYSRREAEQVVARLSDVGYDLNEINVLMSDLTRGNEFADFGTHKASEGAVAGAVIGGGLGAIIAALTATGSLAAIVGTGGAVTPLVAGPLVAALAALGAAGGGGGIVGALIGLGLAEGEAHKYEKALQNGGIIIGVRPHTQDRERVKEILSQRATEAYQGENLSTSNRR